jgi:hypothetical protein
MHSGAPEFGGSKRVNPARHTAERRYVNASISPSGAGLLTSSTTAVIYEPSGFNRRFIAAAVSSSGYERVIEARTIEEFVHLCATTQPELAVIDPAADAGAGITALADVRRAAPGALTVAIGTDLVLLQQARLLGATAVRKVSVLRLNDFRCAIAIGQAPAETGPVVTDDELAAWRVRFSANAGAEQTLAVESDAEEPFDMRAPYENLRGRVVVAHAPSIGLDQDGVSDWRTPTFSKFSFEKSCA